MKVFAVKGQVTVKEVFFSAEENFQGLCHIKMKLALIDTVTAIWSLALYPNMDIVRLSCFIEA